MGAVQRNPDGTFPKGVSGNPLGKAKGIKNKITLERLAFEAALREYVHDPKQAMKLIRGIDRVLDIAQTAEKDADAIAAMKMLLDRTMPVMPPQLGEEAEKTDRRLQIVIQTNPEATAPVTIVNPPLED